MNTCCGIHASLSALFHDAQEQALEYAAAAGLLVGEADPTYLPTPLPPLVEHTLSVLSVKMLVVGWTQEAIDKWIH